MKSNQPQRDTLRARMDDLVTGQLSPFAGWLLRYRIARDPELIREWQELQRLHADLEGLVRSGEVRAIRPAVSVSSIPTIQIGRLVMKRKTVLIAITALTLFAVTGAIAARHFAPRKDDCGFPGVNRDFDWWGFSGTFLGKAAVYTPEGKLVNTINVRGGEESGSVQVIFSSHSRQIAKDSLRGMGRHPLHDGKGALIGYVVLSPLTVKDNERLAQEDREIQEVRADFIQRPERVTPDYEKFSFYHVVALPGVVGGVTGEPISAYGIGNWKSHKYSWKSYGNVRVIAKLQCNKEKVTVLGPQSKRYPVTLEKRTLISEGESMPIPTPEQLSQLAPERRQVLEGLPVRSVTTPETYWAIGGGKGWPNEKGEWQPVIRSGKFDGYGHFVIRDPATNEPALILDVIPPTKRDPMIVLSGRPIVKSTRVVPGWSK